MLVKLRLARHGWPCLAAKLELYLRDYAFPGILSYMKVVINYKSNGKKWLKIFIHILITCEIIPIFVLCQFSVTLMEVIFLDGLGKKYK